MTEVKSNNRVGDGKSQITLLFLHSKLNFFTKIYVFMRYRVIKYCFMFKITSLIRFRLYHNICSIIRSIYDDGVVYLKNINSQHDMKGESVGKHNSIIIYLLLLGAHIMQYIGRD